MLSALIVSAALVGQFPAPQGSPQGVYGAPQGVPPASVQSYQSYQSFESHQAYAPQAAPCAPCGAQAAPVAAYPQTACATPARGRFKEKHVFKAKGRGGFFRGRGGCGGCG